MPSARLSQGELTFGDLLIYVNVSLRSGSHAMLAVRRLRSTNSPEVGAVCFAPPPRRARVWVASAADR
jgi:hypothetical protein